MYICTVSVNPSFGGTPYRLTDRQTVIATYRAAIAVRNIDAVKDFFFYRSVIRVIKFINLIVDELITVMNIYPSNDRLLKVHYSEDY